ncbi:hypothetical protein [Aromatoleum aromaticum]|uniref:hypothetical protein n=1 Tax=Aromatoleum aromaticum TaxID=551760 RepID=UPI00059F6ADF|nr:hypothetical protein [Aromatoleum aromaticum]NMG53610.1 hypothetical protein [Aromatoleum aromaticum]
MTQKTKGRTERHDPKQNDSRDSINVDPVVGWYSLGKASRTNRRPKRTWRHRSGGAINVDLAVLLILAAVAALLLAEGRL